MEKQYDIIVLGAGNAGMAVAGAAHAAGQSVAIVENSTFGGTCPNRGCTPKKVLVEAARSLETIRHADVHHISTSDVRLDWPALIQRKQGLIDFIPDAMERAARNRADVYTGQGRFHTANSILVGEGLLQADKIVVATGSRPRSLTFPGAELLITSDELLELPSVPNTIVMVGGGVIALEFGHILARAGAEVIILEAMPTLLPRMDQEAVLELMLATQNLGIRVETGVEVIEVSRRDQLEVVFRAGGQQLTVSADLVVNGAGRVPNTRDLHLSAGNVAFEGDRIVVDSQHRSVSNPHVFVVGDALAETPQLSPVATREGADLAASIVNDLPLEATAEVIPQAIYTLPALASVGLTQPEAELKYRNLSVHVTDMSGWLSAKIHGEETAWAKILIDADTDQIVGAHLVGHHGEELIHLFTLAINHQISATDLKRTTFAFPTFSSDIKNLW